MEHVSQVADVVWEIFSLLLIALVILVFAKKTRLPFTVLLVLAGIGLAELQKGYPEQLRVLQQLSISPDLILYVFLPTLIFESSYNLDARELKQNIAPILTLAVPGLLISTGLIGLIIWQVTSIPLIAALLLGAILSATDPVAVIALFKQVGAPERLTVLVEGESLFNDATSIVIAKILLGILLAGTLSGDTFSHGIDEFITLFIGGIGVGVALGYLTSKIIGWVESEPFVEIGLTTALAYLSFLFAEEVLHVSGIMATVGAGLTLGTWGRIRISSSVRVYLEHFWELMAFIANALLFLLLGMTVDFSALLGSWDLLIWVVFAMLLARAAIMFGLIPLVGRLPGSRPIGTNYKFIMFWGGLRGAIALAIVLSLPSFEHSELFVALVMGAVLFSLLVQGLSIEPLMHRLGLDIPPLADQVSILEHDLVSKQRAIQRLPELQRGGIFSSRIARRLTLECAEDIDQIREAMQTLREEEMTEDQETSLLYLRALAEERAIYTEMYEKGHLSEGSFRELTLVLNMQIDALRHSGAFQHIHSHRFRRRLETTFYHLAGYAAWLEPLTERMRMARIVRDYEQVWGHYRASGHVLAVLEELAKLQSIPEEVMNKVRTKYQSWNKLATEQLQQVSEHFPEFATLMQERFGQRIILLADLETIEEQADKGMLPKGVAESMATDVARQIAALRGQPVQHLQDDPLALLKLVPLFAELDKASLGLLGDLLHPITLSDNQYLARQGKISDALYLISRGVIRFTQEEEGVSHDYGTLMAGEFFGEKALMGYGSKDASVITVTPCRLFTLQRKQLQELLEEHPALDEKLKARDQVLRASYQEHPAA
ncbi:MAG: cation:proton antiporter [Candidatus Thiodiazotropha sp.]|jgi:CPA1 family monovalent cation:H+ antiporter